MQNKLFFISHLFFSFTYFIFVWQHLSELLISTRALTFITKYLLCDRHYGEHFIITLLTPDNNCDGASSHCTDKKTDTACLPQAVKGVRSSVGLCLHAGHVESRT